MISVEMTKLNLSRIKNANELGVKLCLEADEIDEEDKLTHNVKITLNSYCVLKIFRGAYEPWWNCDYHDVKHLEKLGGGKPFPRAYVECVDMTDVMQHVREYMAENCGYIV